MRCLVEEKVRCTKCKEEKERSEFYKDKHKTNGLQSRCKDCVREANRESSKEYRTSGRAKEKQKERSEKYKKERIEIDGKTCKVCGKWKVRTEYRLNNYTKDGLWAFCKTCFDEKYGEQRKAYNQQYEKDNKEIIAHKHSLYYREHKDDYYRRSKEYKLRLKTERPEENKRRMREASRKQRARNPEKIRDYLREYHRTHKSELKVKRYAYYLKNKEHISVGIKEWGKNNPEKLKMYSSRKMKFKLSSEGSFTDHEWEELCAKYDHKCLACGEEKPLTRDHVIPISLGGRNDIGNIQPLCKSCNSKKHTDSTDYRPTHESIQ